ncbi:alpha-fetoprotein-like [Pitangus sulphuratus]|nr:alpha-fetoprotein-like [Pitangus sulphuratus]
MAEGVTALARRCVAVASDSPDCLKPLDEIFLDTICQEENLPRSAECCAKRDPERNDCFLSLKNSSQGFSSPLERPDAEAACRNHSQHGQPLTGYFIYKVSRRHPFLYAPTILSVALRYEEMMQNCCANAEGLSHHVEECFQRQAPKVMQPVREDALRQEHTCGILKKFGERTLKALKLAQISQKFPQADFVTVHKLVVAVANMHKDCCRGDTLDCMRDREEILRYVCSSQHVLSSRIQQCCEKPLLQRSECILNTQNDDKPAGLSPLVREFIEDKGICERFAQEKDMHLARLLMSFTKKMPQLTSAELIKFTKEMTTIGFKCCRLGQDKLLPCAEEHLDLVLEQICRRHLADPINPGVCRCCSSSYAFRRPCIGKLEIDETYVPLALTPGLFAFHGDLCTSEEEKLQHRKQEMLITLLKYKPQISAEQLGSVTAAFAAMRERCCREASPEACFLKEGPELVKRSEKMLSA